MDTASMLVARRALDLHPRRLDGVAAGLRGARATRSDRRRWPGGRCCSRRCRRRSGSRPPAGSSPSSTRATCSQPSERTPGRAARRSGGTLAALGDRGPEVLGCFAGELGLVEPVLPGTRTARGSPSWGRRSRRRPASLEKIGCDVVLLAQTEVGRAARGAAAAAPPPCRTSATPSPRPWRARVLGSRAGTPRSLASSLRPGARARRRSVA